MYKEPWINTSNLPTPEKQVGWRAEEEPTTVSDSGELLLSIKDTVLETKNVPHFWYLKIANSDASYSLTAALVAAAQGNAYGDTEHYDKIFDYVDKVEYDVHPTSLIAVADACESRFRAANPEKVALGAVVLSCEYSRNSPAESSLSVYEVTDNKEKIKQGKELLHNILPRSLVLSCTQRRTIPTDSIRVKQF